ncbi:hypothetical protein [Anaerococcus cruorum]|uniref:Uncharacterized protein n=1 Tax=Anaerococcus cruorum TaxID=3115617 RepID=A0ABW9MWB5_9FIRM
MSKPNILQTFNLAGVSILLMTQLELKYLFITIGYAILLYVISGFISDKIKDYFL